jgi:polyhydroxyalkanoate synthesis regulator protein
MDNTMLEFTGELDYLQKPRESFRLKMTQIPIDTLRIESKIFPVNIQQGKADITAGINIGENSFNSDIQFSGQNLDIEPFGKSENQMEKVVISIVKNLNIIEFQSKIKNVEGQTDLEIQSNLDQIFMDEMEKIVGSQISKTTQKIKSEINERVKEQRNRLENLQSRNNQLKTVINEYDQLLNQNTEFLEQAREKIEQRIEQEKEKQQDQLLDQLEGLF